MSFGNKDPQVTKTETTAQLSPEQQQILALSMPGLQKWAATTPQRYGGQTIAGFDPSQTSGQEQILKAAGAQQGIADNAAKANAFWTGGDIWKPENNPALRGAIDASVRPITQQLQESILPSIRGGAVSTGNFGSSRQGIAEGLASGRASQAAGDTASKLVNQNYGTNVEAQLKALGMAPQTQQLQLTPGLVTSGVGDVRRAMEQAKLDEARSNYNFDQNAGYLQSRDLISLLHGIPGGTNMSTATGPPPANNWLTNTASVASTLASLGKFLA